MNGTEAAAVADRAIEEPPRAGTRLRRLRGRLAASLRALALLLVAGTSWLSAAGTRRRGFRALRAQRGISSAHAVVLAFGIVILFVGVLLAIFGAGYLPELTPFYILVVAIILIFLGLIETIVEAETRKR